MIHRAALSCTPQINKMSHSLNEPLNKWTAERHRFILTPNQIYWRAAGHLSRLIFCLLFGTQSLFWQNPAHYCWTILAGRGHGKMWESAMKSQYIIRPVKKLNVMPLNKTKIKYSRGTFSLSSEQETCVFPCMLCKAASSSSFGLAPSPIAFCNM